MGNTQRSTRTCGWGAIAASTLAASASAAPAHVAAAGEAASTAETFGGVTNCQASLSSVVQEAARSLGR